MEPLYFRQVDGPFAIVFREDDRGRITHMFTDLMPQYAFEKLDWYETPGFNMALAPGLRLDIPVHDPRSSDPLDSEPPPEQ